MKKLAIAVLCCVLIYGGTVHVFANCLDSFHGVSDHEHLTAAATSISDSSTSDTSTGDNRDDSILVHCPEFRLQMGPAIHSTHNLRQSLQIKSSQILGDPILLAVQLANDSLSFRLGAFNLPSKFHDTPYLVLSVLRI